MYSLGALAQENRWEGHGHVWVTPAKSLCEGLVGKAGGGLCPCVWQQTGVEEELSALSVKTPWDVRFPTSFPRRYLICISLKAEAGL